VSVQEPGRVLGGRYRLRHEVARGGMAAVWAAEDTLLERDVAIKLLHPQYARDAEFLQRFRGEARAAARLSHPNIVPIYDVGEDPDRETRVPFIVMELVDGGNLKDLVRRAGRLPESAIRSIGAALAGALDYAHGRGIIHRDVKPQNVLLGSDDRPRLTDFGIAQAMAGTGLTRTGAVMGSVQYIAPELVRGKPATPASDLYGLGAVLYELATGRVPFEGETDMAVALAHVEETPAAPRALNAGVSADLEATIMRALAKQPDSRFKSGAEMASALRNGLSSVQRSAVAESATQRISTVPGVASGAAGVSPKANPSAPAATAARRAAVAAPAAVPRGRPANGATTQQARRTARPRSPRGASGGVMALLLAMTVILVALGAGFFGLASLSREGVLPPEPTLAPTPGRASPTAPPKPAALPSATPAPAAPPPPTDTPVPEPSATPEPSPSPSPAAPSPSPVRATPTRPAVASPTARLVPVTQLLGKTLAQAQAALKADGLTATVRGVNANVDKDVVAGQQPAAGTSLPPGGTVTILVGTGATTVPDVAGQPRDQATRLLQQNSFHVVSRQRRDDRVPEGIALETRPEAGTVATRETQIELWISTGR
jgi:hypothetical protein